MKQHITIIEHDTSELAIITHILEKEGYVVTGQSDFSSVKQLLSRRVDCFIFADWLPNTSGLALCAILKATPHIRHIPVILTGSVKQLPRLMKLSGANASISKPFRAKIIIPLLAKFFGSLPSVDYEEA